MPQLRPVVLVHGGRPLNQGEARVAARRHRRVDDGDEHPRQSTRGGPRGASSPVRQEAAAAGEEHRSPRFSTLSCTSLPVMVPLAQRGFRRARLAREATAHRFCARRYDIEPPHGATLQGLVALRYGTWSVDRGSGGRVGDRSRRTRARRAAAAVPSETQRCSNILRTPRPRCGSCTPRGKRRSCSTATKTPTHGWLHWRTGLIPFVVSDLRRVSPDVAGPGRPARGLRAVRETEPIRSRS